MLSTELIHERRGWRDGQAGRCLLCIKAELAGLTEEVSSLQTRDPSLGCVVEAPGVTAQVGWVVKNLTPHRSGEQEASDVRGGGGALLSGGPLHLHLSATTERCGLC